MEKFENSIVDKIMEQYSKLQTDNCKSREFEEDRAEERSEYSRDYARILYSSSFRRLQGKMQILGVESTAFYRNRLTHSLEVSQIARSIAKTVSWKCGKEAEMYCDEELYLLDAAALAHDIGHPAFGHKGERVLDKIAKKYRLRFEGNAQNFRVLRELDRHGSSPKGLNLTYRTLLAINKYITDECNSKGEPPKKFMYHEDYEFLENFRKENGLNERTLDVQIIEISDDIAYAVHDLEDGLSQGLFTIEEIMHEIKVYDDNQISNDDINKASNEFDEIIKDIKESLNNEKVNTIQEYSHLFRKRLTSKLSDDFVKSVGFDSTQKILCMDATHKALCKILSKIIFRGATRSSSIALYELKGDIIIVSLFNIYFNEDINKDYLLLPPDYRPNKNDDEAKKARCVIDYIAGMMDTYAISEYERLTGISYKSIDVSIIPNVEESKKHFWDYLKSLVCNCKNE